MNKNPLALAIERALTEKSMDAYDPLLRRAEPPRMYVGFRVTLPEGITIEYTSTVGLSAHVAHLTDYDGLSATIISLTNRNR